MLTSCVHPDGRFRVGRHQPEYLVRNLRERSYPLVLGELPDGTVLDNRANFPQGDLSGRAGSPVYEIRNALPFRGATYIDAAWAASRALDPAGIAMQPGPACSLKAHLVTKGLDAGAQRSLIAALPLPLRYALAETSTDAEELVWLAESTASFLHAPDGSPTGLVYEGEPGRCRPKMTNADLFETIANNPALPDAYKIVMALRPGVQGNSPITADERYGAGGQSGEIFEYLRTNSYIPGGHYAANFAHSSRRYAISELSLADMQGLRHLYYQRGYLLLAGLLGLAVPEGRRALSAEELESLRLALLAEAKRRGSDCPHPATLWGWNFGYDFSPTGYRLHASHQMIHQQYALVPETVAGTRGEPLPAFACGDMVADCAAAYRAEHGSDFFADYLRCIRANTRTDGATGQPASLVVHEDENVLLFVPKAQTSQWELNLMLIADTAEGPVGNIFEAGPAVRASIDRAMLIAQQVLAGMHARMVTTIEYGKRLGLHNGQPLLYAFLPKLPWAMGGFTEAQTRYVSGHYPEDFAAACRLHLAESRR